MNKLWVWPVVAANLVLYAFWIFSVVSIYPLIIALLVFGASFLNVVVENYRDGTLNIKYLLIVIPLVLISAILISPLVRSVKGGDIEFVNKYSVTDYYKHIYTATAINSGHITPVHPYYPIGSYVYYLGYYFLPTFFVKLHLFSLGQIFFVYSIVTGVLAWLSIISVLVQHVKLWRNRVLSIIFLAYGQGLDIWPTIIHNKEGYGKLIELWSINDLIGLRVDNVFTSYLWTPQHFFAAAVALIALNLFFLNKGRLLSGVLLGYVLISSVFVGIFLIVGLISIFLLRNTKLKNLVIVIALGFIMSMPMVSRMIGNGGIFQFYVVGGFNFGYIPVINLLLTLISEYGLVLIMMPIWIFWVRRRILKSIKIILLGCLPILLTWVVKTKGFNDFAIRGTLLWQIISIIFLGYILEKIEGRKKKVLLLLILVNLFVSLLGYNYEIQSRRSELYERLGPEESLLINTLKDHSDKKFMAIGREEWIFMTPIVVGKPILTSSLYDAGQYLGSAYGYEHSIYEATENRIFFTEISGDSINSVLKEMDLRWKDFGRFFKLGNSDWLIVDNRDQRTVILEKFRAESIVLTGKFKLVNVEDLQSRIDRNKLMVSKISKNNEYDRLFQREELLVNINCSSKCVGRLINTNSLVNKNINFVDDGNEYWGKLEIVEYEK